MDQLPELSRIINLEKLVGEDSHYCLTATPEERQALALRFAIVAIPSLNGEYSLSRGKTPWAGYELRGTITANVIQSCIVTLDPVREEVHHKFVVHILNSRHMEDEAVEQYFKDADADIEYQDNGEIDLGEITAQYLSLALNPYPRLIPLKD